MYQRNVLFIIKEGRDLLDTEKRSIVSNKYFYEFEGNSET